MFNKMFFNIGKSIKAIAVITFFIEIISGIFGGLVMIFNAEYFWMLLGGIATILFSPVIAFASVCLIYGFGELVDQVCKIYVRLDNIGKKIDEIERNTGMMYKPDEFKNKHIENEQKKYEENERAKKEAEEKRRRDAEEKARRDAELKARREAEAKAREEARKKAEEERAALAEQANAEKEAKLKAEATAKQEEINNRSSLAAQKYAERASEERKIKEKIAFEAAEKRAKLEEELQEIKEFERKRAEEEKIQHEIEENAKAGIATTVKANRFGEVICPLCHNVLDCGDKIGLQNCSNCGCPIKVTK